MDSGSLCFSRIVVIVCILVLLYEISIFIFSKSSDLYTIKQCTKKVSSIDGGTYCTVDRSKKSIQFSQEDILATINQRTLKLIKSMKAKYANNNIVVNGINTQMVTRNILKNYNQDNLYEAVKKPNSTSFTIDKGSIIGLCTEGSDINTLMYVYLHEVSHIAITEIEHTDMFWKVFKFIQDEAIDAGVYTYVDYKKNPVKYCGMTIDRG